MDSLEKVKQLLDGMMDAPDEILEEMLGQVPVPAARAVMPIILLMLPETAEELDDQIRGYHHFLDQLVSDPAELLGDPAA